MTNEEKILEMLASLTQKQDEQGSLLASLTQEQREQRSELKRQGDQLLRQGVLIEQISKKLLEHDMKFMEQSARLNAIERDLAGTKQTAERAAVLLETEVREKLQLLFDGQKLLSDTMIPSSRVEKLEDEVDTLKGVVRLLSQDIEKLKKAQ